MRKVGDIELEAAGNIIRTKRTQPEGGWWVAAQAEGAAQ